MVNVFYEAISLLCDLKRCNILFINNVDVWNLDIFRAIRTVNNCVHQWIFHENFWFSIKIHDKNVYIYIEFTVFENIVRKHVFFLVLY